MKLPTDVMKTLAAGLVKQAQEAADFPSDGYVVAYGPYALPFYMTDTPQGEQYGLLGTCIKNFRSERAAEAAAAQINARKIFSGSIAAMPAAEWKVAYLLGHVKMAAEAMKGAE